MTDTVIVQEESGIVVVQETVSSVIEVVAVGPQGPQGSAGPQGIQGLKGDTGNTGPQGLKGDTGNTGEAGPQGLTGPQGIAGPQGLQGPTGLTGPTGPQGLTGAKGDTGAGLALKGSQPTVEALPATGNTEGDGWLVAGVLYVWNGTSWTNAGNIQGPAGATGPQGPIGLTGPQGEPGLAGSDASVTNANVLSALGFTPVNKAGDTMLGALAGPGFAGGYFDIDPLATPAAATGRIRWNAARGVPTFGLAGGNVEMELGEGIQLCHNGEATPLNEGEVVYLYGAHGDLPSMRRASNSSELLSSKTFGMVTETIAVNGSGFVTTFGFVNGLNTSAIVAGTALWLGATPGSYTAIKPVAPAHTVFVGIVTKSNPGNGAIFVNPQNGYELEELHDVLLTSPVENDFFVQAADGLWKNRALLNSDITTALGFTPYDVTNPAGYITPAALGPYLTGSVAAATYQPIGSYLTGITSSDITGALGFTPANKAGDAFIGNVFINTGVDSRLLLQSTGVTQGQFQTTGSVVRLASNNALPLYLSQNGVDLLDVTTTAIVGNRQFRVPNSAAYLYAFVGEQTAGAGRYNLYMSGTAANYLAGALQVDGGITGNLTGNVTGNVSGTASSITGTYGGTLTSSQITTALGFTPGTGDVTQSGTQSLTNKTLGSGTLLGATVNGQDNNLTRVELQDYGYAYFNSGTTNALDFTNGSVQRWAPTASSNPTLSITNWPPTGNLGELLVEAVNLAGAGTVTYPTANWIKSDGTFAASPSAAGVTFTSGTDFILFWTRDAGTTIYAKVVR